MKNKIFTLTFVLSVFFLSGCASFFTIGEEKFACKGDAKGGQCGDPATIYRNKEKILNEYENKGTDSKDDDKDTKVIKEPVIDSSKLRQADTPIPIPVWREGEKIRVYINSFKDRKGNLIGNIWTFTTVDDGDWLLPDGRRVVNAE